MHIAILNEVTLELEKELEGTKNKLPLYAAIDNYHGRIENLILSQENKGAQEDWGGFKTSQSSVLKVMVRTGLRRRQDE